MSKAIRTQIARKVRDAGEPVTLGADEALAVADLLDEQGQHEAQRIKQERRDAEQAKTTAAKDEEIAALQAQLRSERAGTRRTFIASTLAAGLEPKEAIARADETIAILRQEPAP